MAHNETTQQERNEFLTTVNQIGPTDLYLTPEWEEGNPFNTKERVERHRKEARIKARSTSKRPFRHNAMRAAFKAAGIS